MKRSSWIIVLLVCVSLNVRAQVYDTLGFPVIGKPCPEFILKGVLDFPVSTVTNKTFSGKWLVLAFWSTGCSSSIMNFPGLNDMRKKFRNDVEFLAIGKEDAVSRPFYGKLKKLYNLEIPVAFDSVLFNKFGIESFPHFMVVDPSGIVRAIPYRVRMEDVESFLTNTVVNLPVKPNVVERERKKTFDLSQPFLVDGNGGQDTDFFQRSILAPWRKGMGSAQYDYAEAKLVINNRFQFVGATLEWLYRLAYGDTIFSMPTVYDEPTSYGTLSRKVILEVSDTMPFQYDYITGEGVYSYSLSVPPGKVRTAYDLQAMMRRDLQNFFGYEVSVEYRMMPYWRLVASDKARSSLKTRGQESIERYDLDKVTLRNQPMYMLIPALWMADQYGPPILDETNIEGNVDIILDAFITDRADVNRGLEKLGLKMLPGKKLMRVIVLRDGVGTH